MSSQLKIGIIIPARMGSTRLPDKPLLDILGLPMIEHVRRRALLSNLSESVLVASGDDYSDIGILIYLRNIMSI